MLRKISFLIFIFQINMIFSQSADIVIRNAKIWTVDKTLPLTDAMAIEGHKIIAVGHDQDIAAYIDQTTRVINAKSRLVLPGFNDAHLHFVAGGLHLLDVSLTNCQTVKEFQDRVLEVVRSTPRGKWITGRGWDHTLFNEGIWPTKKILDIITPHHPVFLKRIDGHVALCNSLALKLADIDAATFDPPGGVILKDSLTREPTGILKETAMLLVQNMIPPITNSKKKLAILKALEHACQLGITSIQDNSGISTCQLYDQLRQSNKLTVRVTEWLDFELLENPEKLEMIIHNHSKFTDNRYIRIGQLKGFLDGTLGSRTAAFFEPYSDNPNTRGVLQIPEEKLMKFVCRAESLNLQVGLHCIGSRANAMAIQSFVNAREKFGNRDARFRLEHAQIMRLQDLEKLEKYNIIASMQPTHCTTDLRWAEERIGSKRCQGAYAWRQILDTGGKIAFGTDWPVEPLNPMRGLYSAVTRRNIETKKPSNGWFPNQKLDMAQAIKLYTLDAAYAEFQENVKGSITPGKFADVVILSNDLFTCPTEKILDTRVVMTLFDGRIIYKDGRYWTD